MNVEVGDLVFVKNQDWFDSMPKNDYGDIIYETIDFLSNMKPLLGTCMKVVKVDLKDNTFFCQSSNQSSGCWWLNEDTIEPVIIRGCDIITI